MNKQTKKRLVVGSLIAVLAIGGGTFAYGYNARASKTPIGAVAKVERGSMVETASASGKIEPHVQVDVKSRASGEVSELLVAEGDRVEAGQLLLRLDKTDAQRDLDAAKVARDRAKADLNSASASVRVAALEVDNNKTSEALAKKSVDLGVGTNDAVRSATHAKDVASANASLKSAQLQSSKLALETSELAVQDAETRLKETDIYAPIAGTVLSLAVEKGTIVSSALTNVSGGSAVLTIADLSDLRIIGSIDEAQISKVAPGQSVDIRVDAYPSKTFKGTVDRVSPLGIETSSVVTFDVEIKILDENASLLRSGMSADVEIVTVEQKDVLLVPLTAIQSKDRKRMVKLASGEERIVETSTTDGTRMIITKGLEEGDTIVAVADVTPKAATTGNQQSGQNPMRTMGGGMGNGAAQRSGGGR